MSERKHILLVEDTLELADVIQKELSAAGYAITHTSDGESALRLATQQAFALLILDWMLPGLSGLEVVRTLRATAIPAVATLPILMLTARDGEIDRVLGLEVGADDYLTKPFSMRELITRVRAMLRRRELIEQLLHQDRQASPTVMTVDALQLDPAQHTANLQGAAVELTRTEFALLHLLVSNPGRVFSRSYLLDTVWDGTYNEGDRAVDNAILRLRKKLQTMGTHIETVWGVGYRWKRP